MQKAIWCHSTANQNANLQYLKHSHHVNTKNQTNILLPLLL